MRLVLAFALVFATSSCSRPRHGVYTAGIGLGIGVGGLAAGFHIDRDASAPGDGFGVAMVSGGIGLGLIVIGLGYAAFKQFMPEVTSGAGNPSGPTGVGWERAAQLGDQAREAARNGDCARATTLANEAQLVDERYYDNVLRSDPTLARCSR
jgi:hypothetical protein